MHPRTDQTRISRVRVWVLVLTLTPACVLLVPGYFTHAAGLASGGIIVFLNLLGTQRAVKLMVEGDGIERTVAVLVWFGKFGITAAVIIALLYSRKVGQLALLLGLGSLPVSLVFDIFLFPVNKGEAKKP